MKAEEIRSFAEKEVLATLARRYENREFSRDLWQKMAGAGLFGFLLPPAFGGTGRGLEALLDAIDVFVTAGCDLGLCLSWLDHVMIHTHVIHRFGTPGQREAFLPHLAGGDRIGALAASEPGTGANPVKMQTSAEPKNGGFTIRGHKIFITNGPVADFIIVLARTGSRPGKEGISAFLMDASTPGFEVRETMDLGFLNTSPHGELVFHNCPVPGENLLGGIGQGHVGISRAVFGWERHVVLIALGAHFRAMLDRLLQSLSREPGPGDRETHRRIASAHVTLEGLREISRERAARALERNGLDRNLVERLLFIGQAFQRWWDDFEKLLGRVKAPEDPIFSILLKDARLLQIDRTLHNIQMDRIAGKLIGRAPEAAVSSDG